MVEMTKFEVDEQLKDNDITWCNRAYLEYTDGIYEVPTTEQFISLAKQVASKQRFRYLKDQRDCEDAVRIMRGKLSEYGYGNLSIASSKVYVFEEWHECILAVCTDGLVVYEPISKRTGCITDYAFKRVLF